MVIVERGGGRGRISTDCLLGFFVGHQFCQFFGSHPEEEKKFLNTVDDKVFFKSFTKSRKPPDRVRHNV
jgi:hypothetical protein